MEELSVIPQKRSMYDIRIEHLQIMQMIEDNEGEITEEIEQQLALTQDQFETKALSYGFVVKHFDDEASVISKEIKRLQDRLQKVNKAQEEFKERLSAAMQQFGVEKIETPTLKLSFRKSSSTEVSEDFSDNMIKYFKLSFGLDKDALESAKKELEELIASATEDQQELIEEKQNELALLSIVPELEKCFNVKPSFVKTPLTELMKQGIKIPGVSKVDKKNLQIK
jgi:hypothetical protein